jgi:N4-gp56 family major capsid protein
MGQQLWSVSSLGGYLSNNELSKQIRHRSQTMQKFRQFVSAEPAAGANRGEKVFFNKISNISTAGGTLVETDTIPKRNYTITQGTMTITEYGNSVPFTLKAKTLADVQVPEIVNTVLRNDMGKVLDSAAATQFKTNDYIATITNTATTTFGSAGLALATAGANMSDKNVRDIVDRMKTLNIPTYDGENYACIGSTNSIRGLYDFMEAKAVQTTMAPLYRGEVGQYYKTRFVEETNFLSNTDGSNGLYGEAVFFGADAVREGIAIPEEIRVAIPTDFGRDQGAAWYALLGFQQVWDFSSDGETRIIVVDSL